MALDGTKNFATTTVSLGYDAAATSIVLTTGHGARLPDPATANFNLVWYDSTNYGSPELDPNVEIVRCTAKSTDTLTVTRAQEGTSATTKNTGGATYKMILAITAKMITDIQTLTSPASTTAAGIAELSIETEVAAGTDTTRIPRVADIAQTISKGSFLYAADAGSTDAYAITLVPAPSAYVTGAVYHFKANTINTGACTLNVNSLGAITIKKQYNVDLADGDIKAGQLVSVIYDGTNFQLLSQTSAAASGGAGAYAVRTTDFSSTTESYVDVTDVVKTLTANKKYKVKVYAEVRSATGAQPYVACYTSASITISGVAKGYLTTTSVQVVSLIYATKNAEQFASLVPAANGTIYYEADWLIIVGGADADLKLQVYSVGGATSTVKAGAHIIVQEVA